MRDCFATFEAADKGAIRWGAVGPDLVTRKFVEHGLQQYALPVDAICPVDFWDAHLLASRPLPDNPGTLAVHFWNGMWRHRKLDKDASPALKRLPEIASQFQDAVTKANRLIGSVDQGYGGSSKFHRDLDRLIPQLTDTARSIRALADLLSRHPEALIKGRTNTGKE